MSDKERWRLTAAQIIADLNNYDLEEPHHSPNYAPQQEHDPDSEALLKATENAFNRR